ncbi:MAG: histidine kinase [Gemmatimonadaceae bacterium]|nr:histidine kinase [Gemmatimonadaceae bacterium]
MDTSARVPAARVSALGAVVARRWFLVAQLVGWTVYVIGGLLAYAADAGFPAALTVLGPRTMRAAVGGVLSTFLAIGLGRLPETRRRPALVLVVAIAAAVCTGVLWYPLSRLLWHIVSRPADAPFSLSCLLPCMVDHAWQMLIWTMLFLTVRDLRTAYARERDAEGAARSAVEARYRMLASQVHPHFLFNALNAIRALVPDEPARAREVITEVGGFLRYSLGVDPSAMVPLHREFDAVRRYLAVEQVRVGERLVVAIDLDPSATEVLVPAFLLHPLVENAVTHGDDGADGILRIRVSARTENDAVVLRVLNSGTLAPRAAITGFDVVPSRGIGVRNVRERLALVFPGRHDFTLTESAGQVEAMLRVPRA